MPVVVATATCFPSGEYLTLNIHPFPNVCAGTLFIFILMSALIFKLLYLPSALLCLPRKIQTPEGLSCCAHPAWADAL